MNIEAYISSGVIESYVLGILSPEEILEVEKYAKLYPEIRKAIDEQLLVVEKLVDSTAVQVPENLKEKIWATIENDAKIDNELETPAVQQIPFSTPKERSFNYWAAASILLLLTSIAANIFLWQKNNKSNERIGSLQQQQDKLQALDTNKDELIQSYQEYIMLANSKDVKKVAMSGVGNHATDSALVLWDQKTKYVYISINNLGQPPNGKQYQLWAIVAGKPVDAGTFDSVETLKKMKAFENAEMFAVTVEKRGGAESPTLSEMRVAGKT